MCRSVTQDTRKGQAMVEFALVLPVLLLIISGIIAFAHLFFVYFTVVSASREAARWGIATGISTNGGPHYKDCDAITAAAVRVGAVAGVKTSSVQINYDKGPGDASNFTCPYNPDTYDRIKVTVTVNYTPLIPLVNLPSFPITANSKRTIMLYRKVGETPVAGSVQPTTSISLIPDPDPNATSSKNGALQKFKVIITASDGSLPSGTVTFTDKTTGQNSSCGASFSPPSPAGSAKTCSFTFNVIGAHNLVVDFTPTGKYVGPTPTILVWPVASKMTTTSIASINPPTQQNEGLGVDVVVQVAVKAPDTSSPAGNVSLTYGDEFVAQAPVQSNGKAYFNQVLLSKPGTNALTAVYLGNGIFGSSQDTEIYTIYAQAHPVLTLTANPTTALVDANVTFTLNVKGSNVGDPIPTGMASISDNASHSCSATLDSSGTMSCTWKYSGAGNYKVTATYPGNGTYNSATTVIDYKVTQLVVYDTETKISVSPPTGFANQPATITVQVISPGGTPSGTLNITGPGGLSCPNPLTLDSSGQATCTTVFTEVSYPTYEWPITADYISNSPIYKNSSKTFSHNVNPIDTSIFISANPDTDQYNLGNTVTFTIQVNAVLGGTPSGTVSVTGTGGINCPNLTLSNGKATCSVAYGTYGTYLVSAMYQSDTTGYNNSGPTDIFYFAWPRPTANPPSKCPQPPNGFAIDFSTSKQIKFMIKNPNNGVNQSISSIDVYWPNSAENTKLIRTALENTTLSSSEHFPTIANIIPADGGSLDKNKSKQFIATFDHDLGSGTYVVVVNFTQNACSLVVRSTR